MTSSFWLGTKLAFCIASGTLLAQAPQVVFAGATVDSAPNVDIGTEEAALARNETLANDPGNRPPAGTQLAFVRDDQIYLVNSDGTGLAQLTNTGGGVGNREPAWSPDGQRLAFARGNSDTRTGLNGDASSWDIYIMNADGSNVLQLTSGGYNYEPAWGPDGHTIAFTSLFPGRSVGVSVIDVDADGSQGSRVLLDFPGWDAQPAWSPDGQTITFTSDFRGFDFLSDLYAMNADGSDVRPLLEGPVFWTDGLTYYFQSAWSPDGQSIGVVICPYAWDNCYPDSAIAVANADGSGLRVIAQAGSYARPTWSPDGRWIAYGSSLCRTCQSSIRFVHIDGGTEGLIVENGHSPAWRPAASPVDLVPNAVALNGLFYDPSTPGQGFDVNLHEQGMTVYFYGHTKSGERLWLISDLYPGDIGYNVEFTLPMYEVRAGVFGSPRPEESVWGSLAIRFQSCDSGTGRLEGVDGTIEIQFVRLVGLTGVSCDTTQHEQNIAVRALEGQQSQEPGLNGLFYDAASPGHGFDFNVHASGTTITYYGHTAGGARLWLISDLYTGAFRPDVPIAMDFYQVVNGTFGNPIGPETHWGKLELEMNDCDTGSAKLDGADGHLTMNLTRLVALPGFTCDVVD